MGRARRPIPLSGVLLFLLAAASLGMASEPGEVRIRSGAYYPGLKISAQTDLVDVGVTVRDRRGAAVGGWKSGDFEVFDNRVPQTIKFFAEQRKTAAGPAAAP